MLIITGYYWVFQSSEKPECEIEWLVSRFHKTLEIYDSFPAILIDD